MHGTIHTFSKYAKIGSISASVDIEEGLDSRGVARAVPLACVRTVLYVLRVPFFLSSVPHSYLVPPLASAQPARPRAPAYHP